LIEQHRDDVCFVAISATDMSSLWDLGCPFGIGLPGCRPYGTWRLLCCWVAKTLSLRDTCYI